MHSLWWEMCSNQLARPWLSLGVQAGVPVRGVLSEIGYYARLREESRLKTFSGTRPQQIAARPYPRPRFQHCLWQSPSDLLAESSQKLDKSSPVRHAPSQSCLAPQRVGYCSHSSPAE